MRNVFKKDQPHNQFVWQNAGDIEAGRPKLGNKMPSGVYKLMQYTLMDVISTERGVGKAHEYFFLAGFLAGSEFAVHRLNLNVSPDRFILELKTEFRQSRMVTNMETIETLLAFAQAESEYRPYEYDEELISKCMYEYGLLTGAFNAYNNANNEATGATKAINETNAAASAYGGYDMSNVFTKNVFKKDEPHNQFTWASLGDIEEGRGDLGVAMPVLVYRLMQFTMLDVLTKGVGPEEANEYFRQAGFLAGTEFAKNMLDLTVDFNDFVAMLQSRLQKLKIGILRMEAFDPNTGNIILTVGEDLDCSGLPISNEVVCNYDEGFIAGILKAYTGNTYEVREVDCWASGDRVCRFNANVTA